MNRMIKRLGLSVLLVLSASSGAAMAFDYYTTRDWNSPGNMYDNRIHNTPCNSYSGCTNW